MSAISLKMFRNKAGLILGLAILCLFSSLVIFRDSTFAKTKVVVEKRAESCEDVLPNYPNPISPLASSKNEVDWVTLYDSKKYQKVVGGVGWIAAASEARFVKKGEITLPVGEYPQGFAVLGDYYVIGLQTVADSNLKDFAESRIDFYKRKKDGGIGKKVTDMSGCFGHLHSIFTKPGTNTLLVDTDLSRRGRGLVGASNGSATISKEQWEVVRKMAGNTPLCSRKEVNNRAENACLDVSNISNITKSSSSTCSTQKLNKDTPEVKGKKLISQSSAYDTKGEYSFVFSWDYGGKGEGRKDKGSKVVYDGVNDSGSPYFYCVGDSNLYKYRHANAVFVKANNSGQTLAVFYIPNGLVKGEGEGISTDEEGNVYLLYVEKGGEGDSKKATIYMIPRDYIDAEVKRIQENAASGVTRNEAYVLDESGNIDSIIEYGGSAEGEEDAEEDDAGAGVGDNPSVEPSTPSAAESECSNGVKTNILGNGCVEHTNDGDDIYGILLIIFNVLSAVIGVAGTVGVVISGYVWLTSSGNEAQVAAAKKRLMQIVIGLVAYALMFVLLQWIIPGGIL